MLEGHQYDPNGIGVGRSNNGDYAATEQSGRCPRLKDPFPVPSLHHHVFETPTSLKSLVGGVQSKNRRLSASRRASASPPPPPPRKVCSKLDAATSASMNAVLGQQRVVAVNGRYITGSSSSEEEEESDNNNNIQSMTTLDDNDDDNKPFCKTVVACLTLESGPGLSFESVRGDSLVRVSHIYNQECWSELRRGDIVLAVNGVAVQTSHDANTVLRRRVAKRLVVRQRQSTAADAASAAVGLVVLYVLDLAQYQEYLMAVTLAYLQEFDPVHLQRHDYQTYIHPDWINFQEQVQTICLVPPENAEQGSYNLVVTTTRQSTRTRGGAPGAEELVYTGFVFDCISLHLRENFGDLSSHLVADNARTDDQQLYDQWIQHALFLRRHYVTIVPPFLKAYNQHVEQDLMVVQQAVAKAVWLQQDDDDDDDKDGVYARKQALLLPS